MNETVENNGQHDEKGHTMTATTSTATSKSKAPIPLTKKVLIGHAYHQNLPSHYIDDDGVSKITKYAHRKARTLIRLMRSIQLTEDLYNEDASTADGDTIVADSDGDNFDDIENDDLEEEDLEEEDRHKSPSHIETLVSIVCYYLE